MIASLRRIWAITYRHLVLWPRNIDKLVEAFWWPLLDVILWGLVTVYVTGVSDGPTVATAFLSAAMLWSIMYRSGYEMPLAFLEETWNRNLIHLAVTPLHPIEYLIGTVVVSAVKLLLGVIAMLLAAWALFSYAPTTLGFAFIPSIVMLTAFGWAIGLGVTGAIVRFGTRVQSFAWTFVFIFQPISCAFYPLATLPEWLQPIARAIPTTHVFEGMRATLATGRTDWPALGTAGALNVVWLIIASAVAAWGYHRARVSGAIARQE
ncbi:MAG: ABC transporter permease [bacterium]|nr:ABC transporter permease [bacterium]